MVKENLSTAMVNEEFGLVIIHRLYKVFFFFQIIHTCTTDIRVVVVVVVPLNKFWAELSTVR